MSLGPPKQQGRPQPLPPWAALALLCPSAWLPAEGGAADDEEEAVEDYRVCLLRSVGAAATFPGRELASADRAVARANRGEGDGDEGDVFLALRVAAIRRTFESAGMMVAANPPPSFARQELQIILLREGPMAFLAFMDDWGITLQPDNLSELGWLYMPDLWGPGSSPREEHVFLAQVPDAAELGWARAAPPEDFRGGVQWLPPSRALCMYEQGELELSLAQWLVLHELAARAPSFHALPGVLAAPPEASLWRPEALEARLLDDGRLLALPGDEEHPSRPGAAGSRHRLWLHAGAGGALRAAHLQRALALGRPRL